MRLLLYTGKGGVGKTTTAAATAVCAAERGRRTLVVSADAAHSLGDVFERRLGPEPIELAPRLAASEIDPRAEMQQHWGRIRDYLVLMFRHQGIEDVVAEELAQLPGTEEITTLLAVERHATSGRYDLVIVDCAPTDSALRLATLPEVAHRALRLLLPTLQALTRIGTPVAQKLVSTPLPRAEVFRDAETLIFDKLTTLRARITHPTTSVRIVVTPERMVIDEARRAYTELSLFEVPCDAVVMNRLLPGEAAREPFFQHWGRVQDERCREVEELFAPLALLRAPLLDDEATGCERLAELGRKLFEKGEPDDRLGRSERVRYGRDAAGYFAQIPLPNASADDVDVVV
ncbi:MAG TPA: ArsA family ATPase, partial [Myxococcota bacterium]|nr:ArsA family ATPase [Myxococcota bacterium]